MAITVESRTNVQRYKLAVYLVGEAKVRQRDYEGTTDWGHALNVPFVFPRRKRPVETRWRLPDVDRNARVRARARRVSPHEYRVSVAIV